MPFVSNPLSGTMSRPATLGLIAMMASVHPYCGKLGRKCRSICHESLGRQHSSIGGRTSTAHLTRVSVNTPKIEQNTPEIEQNRSFDEGIGM